MRLVYLLILLLPTTGLCGVIDFAERAKQLQVCNSKMPRPDGVTKVFNFDGREIPHSSEEPHPALFANVDLKEASLIPKKTKLSLYKEVQIPPDLSFEHSYTEDEKTMAANILAELEAYGSGEILKMHLKAMRFRLDLLPYALDNYEKGKDEKEKREKLVQDILSGNADFITAINAEAKRLNLGEGARPEKFAGGGILANTDVNGNAFYTLQSFIAVGREKLLPQVRLSLYSALLTLGSNVEIQLQEVQGKDFNKPTEVLKKGKVAYILESRDGYQIGFEEDNAYFQVHWDDISYVRVLEHVGQTVDLNVEYRKTKIGEVYGRQSLPALNTDLNFQIAFEFISQNLLEAQRILNGLQRVKGDRDFYKDLEFIRGIQLVLLFDHYKQRYPKDPEMPYRYLLDIIKRRDNAPLNEYVNKVLSFFPADKYARFARPPNRFGF